MLIQIFNKQKAFKIAKPPMKKIVEQVILFEGQTCDEVSIHFVTAKEIAAIHLQFFDDPTETDCISFPLDSQTETHYRLLGDVFVCPEVAISYAALHKKPAEEEVILYVVHGLLHLMGYDDSEKKDRALMRAAEKRHMANLLTLNLSS